ncbi:MAG: hypothetical protein AAF591_07185 [Verrucomicrobiota bacterium]
MNPTYESYTQWRKTVTEVAGLALDAAYCRERIDALSNDRDPSTLAFVKAYGSAHRDQIVRWFKKALAD